MIFRDITPEDKFNLGTKCKIYGRVDESGDQVAVNHIRNHRYCIVDNTGVSWTKNGLLYHETGAYFLKDLICMRFPRIIPI
jgi:hypothetical protein